MKEYKATGDNTEIFKSLNEAIGFALTDTANTGRTGYVIEVDSEDPLRREGKHLYEFIYLYDNVVVKILDPRFV